MNELKICPVCGKIMILVPSDTFGWVWKCPDNSCKENFYYTYNCTSVSDTKESLK